jgi:multidrug resistance efflux pump
MIEEGATVRNRQELIKLPDVSAMKLAVRIHESHINQVHVGQPVFVVLDAMPDQRFGGVVSKVRPCLTRKAAGAIRISRFTPRKFWWLTHCPT